MTEASKDFQIAAGQTIGTRTVQEDSFLCIERAASRGNSRSGRQIFLAVADGMGGHDGGDVASALVIGAVQRQLATTSTTDLGEGLMQMVEAANAAITHEVANDAGPAGMGTTLTAAMLGADGLRWASVGDSLLLIVRDGVVRRLNADHSMAPQLDAMAARGDITADEAANSPSRNRLRSVLNGGTLSLVDVRADPEPIDAGDIIVVATDGILSLNDAQIAHIAMNAPNASGVVTQLLGAIEKLAIPDQDNTTIVAAKLPLRADPPQLPAKRPARRTSQRGPRSLIAVWLLATFALIALSVAATIYFGIQLPTRVGLVPTAPTLDAPATREEATSSRPTTSAGSLLDQILPAPAAPVTQAPLATPNAASGPPATQITAAPRNQAASRNKTSGNNLAGGAPTLPASPNVQETDAGPRSQSATPPASPSNTVGTATAADSVTKGTTAEAGAKPAPEALQAKPVESAKPAESTPVPPPKPAQPRPQNGTGS